MPATHASPTAAGRTVEQLRQLMPPLAVYLAADEIDDTLDVLGLHLRSDEIGRRVAFRDRIAERPTRIGAP